MRRRGLAIALLVMMVGLVVTPWALGKQTLQIMVHDTGDYLERTMQFWEIFGRENPDIDVEVVPGPAGGSSPEEKLAVMVAAGVPPDLVRTWNAKQLGATGLLQDITPRFQTLPATVRDDFWPALIEDLSYEGRLYALPLGTVATVYFYNKQQFAEKGVLAPSAAWSWEREGVIELKKFTVDLNGDGVIDRWGMGLVGGDNLYPFMYSAGKGRPLFSENGREFYGNTTEVRDALQVLQDLAQVHGVMRTSGGWTDFAEQTVATLVWGSFMAGYFPRYENLDWDFALFPTLNGERAAVVWAETPYGISVGAKNADLAWRALEFIASTEGQQQSIRLGWGVPPARRSVTVGPFLQHFRGKNIDAVAQMLSMPYNGNLPRLAPTNAVNMFKDTCTTVILGQKAPAQALDEVTPTITAILENQ
ncbi:MAG: extracellular solute-binding protein [Firmicutes bacterium]|jgi:multiple sugar transport system substrate-binding protein|nr:extracellular solute-binding protein [Bacillota bacterium]